MDQNTPITEVCRQCNRYPAPTADPGCLLHPDRMLAAIQQDRHVLQHILRVVLSVESLEITRLDTRCYAPDLRGDCPRLTAEARDAAGTEYCIMFLQPTPEMGPRQIRYYTDVLLEETLFAGADSDAPQYYAVVLTQEDAFGDGEAKHLFAMMDRDTHIVLPGCLAILYANGQYQGENPIGTLMADLRETDPARMQSLVLRAAVTALLETWLVCIEEMVF